MRTDHPLSQLLDENLDTDLGVLDAAPDADEHHATRVVLWSMRLWVYGLKSGAATGPAIDEVFRAAGAPSASSTLHTVMTIIGLGAQRRLDLCFPCTCLARLDRCSQDERLLIGLLVAAQAGETLDDGLLMRSLLTPVARGVARELLGVLAGELTAAGLRVRPLPAEGGAGVRPVPLRVVAGGGPAATPA